MGSQAAPVVIVHVSASSGNEYLFHPQMINATTGTVVSFQFASPGNHSVVQSSFANPCDPLVGGFDSGFTPAKHFKNGSFPMFNYTVTDDQSPMWFFCKQESPTSHCHQGMVGVINGVPARFKTFQDKAEVDTVSPTNSLLVPPNNPSGAPSPTTVSHSKAPVPVGVIVGATIGALVLLALLCVAAVVLRRRRRHFAQLDGMRPDPLILNEKEPLPPENPTPVLSAILREMRSLRRHMSIRGRGRSRGPRSDASQAGPPPKYTIS